MSEGEKTTEQAGSEADPPRVGRDESPPKTQGRVDEDGLPLDREPTLDDVRGNAGSGRAIAIGCTLLVVIAIGAFWLLRAGLLG
jgi:hypothetical protein